jgi:hypothetical protein
MNKCTQLLPFMRTLFDDPETINKAARVVTGIMKSRSPRLSDISRAMAGKADANYKTIQRFLEANDPQEVLVRLFRPGRSFFHNWRSDRDAATSGKEERVCRYFE